MLKTRLDEHLSSSSNPLKNHSKSRKMALGPNSFFACGALQRASPRGPCRTAQDRLPHPGRSYPSGSGLVPTPGFGFGCPALLANPQAYGPLGSAQGDPRLPAGRRGPPLTPHPSPVGRSTIARAETRWSPPAGYYPQAAGRRIAPALTAPPLAGRGSLSPPPQGSRRSGTQ